MDLFKNELLEPKPNPTIDLDKLTGPASYRQRRRQRRRELRDLRRAETAAAAIAGWTRSIELHGFTKGQFSLIDLIEAVLEITGPAFMFISTWTAANNDITRALEFLDRQKVISSRWLVDLTFQKRAPQLAQRIRRTAGADAIRVGKVHAKLVILKNDKFDVVINTSMNLNYNPRFENFILRHDPDLAAFYLDLADEIWSRQRRTLSNAKPGKIEEYFKKEM